jgi:hypothetical protein
VGLSPVALLLPVLGVNGFALPKWGQIAQVTGTQILSGGWVFPGCTETTGCPVAHGWTVERPRYIGVPTKTLIRYTVNGQQGQLLLRGREYYDGLRPGMKVGMAAAAVVPYLISPHAEKGGRSLAANVCRCFSSSSNSHLQELIDDGTAWRLEGHRSNSDGRPGVRGARVRAGAPVRLLRLTGSGVLADCRRGRKRRVGGER